MLEALVVRTVSNGSLVGMVRCKAVVAVEATDGGADHMRK